MSAFGTYLRAGLVRRRTEWAAEWDRAFREADFAGSLREVEARGGDPDFCLFVLAEYRWRRLTPLPDLWQRDRLLKAVGELMNAKGWWADRIRARAGRWERLEAVLGEIRDLLTAAKAIDGGQHWTTLTASRPGLYGEPSSEHRTISLSLLDRHLKHGLGTKRTPKQLLARLLSAFELLPDEASPDDWIEKRLERVNAPRGEQAERRALELKLPLSLFYGAYHDAHRDAGLQCGRACELARSLRHADRVERGPDGVVFSGWPARVLLLPRRNSRSRRAGVDSKRTMRKGRRRVPRRGKGHGRRLVYRPICHQRRRTHVRESREWRRWARVSVVPVTPVRSASSRVGAQ